MKHNSVDIRSFELDVRLVDGAERSYRYRSDGGAETAHMTTRECLGERERRSEIAAMESVRTLLAQVDPTPRMTRAELLQRLHHALHLNAASIEHLDVAVEFSNGFAMKAREHESLRASWHRHAELTDVP